jgi:hypothetical protein
MGSVSVAAAAPKAASATVAAATVAVAVMQRWIAFILPSAGLEPGEFPYEGALPAFFIHFSLIPRAPPV